MTGKSMIKGLITKWNVIVLFVLAGSQSKKFSLTTAVYGSMD